MQSQSLRVRFPLSTKLIFSVVTLLMLVIGFLDVSTILLFREDKRAYTYQAQATEAQLVAEEFRSIAKGSIDTLRQTIATLNPLRPVTTRQINALQTLVDNQTEVVLNEILLLKPGTGETVSLAKVKNNKRLSEFEFDLETLRPTPQQFAQASEQLLRRAFAFINLSTIGQQPAIAVVFADLGLKNNPTGVPISVGVVPLNQIGRTVRSEVSIVTQTGDILFDSDPEALFVDKIARKTRLLEQALSSKVRLGAMEYEGADGQTFLGSYFQPGLATIVMTRTPKRRAMMATYALTEKFILLGLMAIGLTVVFGVFFSKSLTAPLNSLYEGTQEVAKGNFQLSLKTGSRDEIGALSSSFNSMSKKIESLIKESMEKVRLQNELEIASTVQQTLIPPERFDDPRLHIRSYYESAEQCGGDWWGFFGVGDKVAVMIADATGHGFPSALITSAARSCFSVMHKMAQEDPDFNFSPSGMLSYANRVIHDSAKGQIMMTFFIAVIDMNQRTLTFSNAGHNFPWIFRKENGGIKMISLVAKGTRLGETRNEKPFIEKMVQLQADDLIFLYTDGILEGKNGKEVQFGKKRMRKVFEEHFDQGPERIMDRLMRNYRIFKAGVPNEDDLTMAILRVYPSGPTMPVQETMIGDEEVALKNQAERSSKFTPPEGSA